MRTRVDMMLEYHRGEWSSWDVLETVRIYNKEYPDDAFPLDGLDPSNEEVKSPGAVPKTTIRFSFISCNQSLISMSFVELCFLL